MTDMKTETSENRTMRGTAKTIAISKLMPHPLEPDMRIDDPALTGLREDILVTGYIHPLWVMATDGRDTYWVRDGNRRLKIAASIGRTDLECSVVPATAERDVMFVRLNGHVRRKSGRELLSL